MKHKDLLLNAVFGGCLFFVLYILISLVFQKLPPFDTQSSLADIMIEALAVGVLFGLVMYFSSRIRLKNRHSHKN
jgi:membrane protein CcdC involved in cytochrome C biogenesis